MASSPLDSSEEKIYGFKLMRLIIDGGTEQLRNVFSNKCPGNLKTVLATHYLTLYHLFKTKNIITQPQWDKLFPSPPAIPNIKEFDITLLVILLRNICGLSSPATGWNVMPSFTDNSLEADIVRIRLFRNNFFGHVPGTEITRLDFEFRWADVSLALKRLGLRPAEIDKLKTEECGEEEINRVRTEWSKSEKEVVIELGRLGKKIDESLKQNTFSTKDIVSECLHQHDFKEEIESFYKNYTQGTREWVFDQVSKWLNDKFSDNRAFIISGQTGMGKSTIAAVICKHFHEHFAACHFFQYNNSRYNDPKFLFQSLAWQLCHVIPEYKQNLTNNLSGNKAQSLKEQNIEGMFSMLFTEPFSNIPDPGKHFLIVIDALDECRQEQKRELVDLITKHLRKFPTFIRFLITTRSETNIINKFEELYPLFLQTDDERNLNDLRLLFEDKLGKDSSGGVVNKLVDQSDGLMLYASFHCKLSAENNPIISVNEDLPVGIEESYNKYFKRLEGDLKKLGVDEKQFLKLLSVIAVSKQPLPLALVERLFSTDKNLSIAARTLRKLIDCFSSLFVIKDESLLFFHKSVKDWLVKPDHDFTIIEIYGHRALADISVLQMQTLKQNEVSSTFDRATVYALQYGTQHILEAKIENVYSLTKLISYVIDLEIVHASVCVDIYSTLSNLSSLESYNMENSLVCEKTQTTIRTLISILRKFTYILKDAPQSFLQHVVNENDVALSSQATALLMTSYRGLAYFELENKQKNTKNGLISRTFTESKILEIDISPSEDLLICVYCEGIELFSLPDFKSLWKINNFVLEQLSVGKLICFEYIPLRRLVFHPFEEVIFPGELTHVFNFEGKFVRGRFMHNEPPNKFTTSCFSHDKTKMVTNYGNHLTVWNLLENKKIKDLYCRSELYSVLFSANDRFIGTTNINNELRVYDTENSYSVVSRFFGAKDIKVLVSTFKSDSWFVVNDHLYNTLELVKHDLTIEHVRSRYASLTSVYPANTKAAITYQAVMESDDGSLFWKLLRNEAIFFILRDKSVFVYRKFQREIKLIELPELIPDSNVENTRNNVFFILWTLGRLSLNGRYIYSMPNSYMESFSIVKLSSPRSVKSIFPEKESVSFVPVTNGVFLCGEIRKSSTGKDCLYPGIPELWNFGVTQRLASFPELIGTCDCVSVTQDLVACIMQSEVCFFNVLKKEIIARTPFPEHILDLNKREKIKVIACSSLYHVLMGGPKYAYLLQDANSIDLKSRVFKKTNCRSSDCISAACFSPNGQSLAFHLVLSGKMLYILDIATLNVRQWAVQSSLLSKTDVETKPEFVDEEHLICDGYNDCLCLVNVKTCEILTCIPLNLCPPWGVFKCCNTVGILTYDREYEKCKLIKLWLPQQRKNKNELPDCSCLIHGENINELNTFLVEYTKNMIERMDFPSEGCRCSIM